MPRGTPITTLRPAKVGRMAARSGGGSLLPPGQPFCVEVGTDSLAIGWDAPVPLQPDLLLGYKVMVQAGGTDGFVV